MRDPVAVANKILEVAKESSDPSVTPMQLIKLAYLCHGWMLGLYGRPLLSESVEAWQYGPVVRSIYKAVSKHRDKPVEYPIKNMFGHSANEEFDEAELDIIQQVYRIYGGWSGLSLSNLTHQPGTPWSIVWSGKGKNSVISNDLIESHFKEKARASAQ